MIIYVQEQGKPKSDDIKMITEALVFAIIPLQNFKQGRSYFAKVVFMNFFLYL